MEQGLTTPRTLGRTGLAVGPLGFGASYSAPAAAYEAAFERGCNYFWWGAMRRRLMARAIRNLAARGRREKLVVAAHSFARTPALVRTSVERALRQLGLDYVDILVLGYQAAPPPPPVIDAVGASIDAGLVRHLGLSGHNRALLARLAPDRRFGVFHVRYSAAHPGAERDFFSALGPDRPGVVAFTSMDYGRLLDPRITPAGERTPRASDCYRFALSHPAVDAVAAGPNSTREMDEALKALEEGPLTADESAWMRRVGAAAYAHNGRGLGRIMLRGVGSFLRRWVE